MSIERDRLDAVLKLHGRKIVVGGKEQAVEGFGNCAVAGCEQCAEDAAETVDLESLPWQPLEK